jgi:hypothetical protein
MANLNDTVGGEVESELQPLRLTIIVTNITMLSESAITELKRNTFFSWFMNKFLLCLLNLVFQSIAPITLLL